jgi:hypothetical protein
MAMVSAGSVVTVIITNPPTYSSDNDVVAGVSSILAQSGYGVQSASTQSAGILDNILALGPTSWQATMSIYTPNDFGDPQDLVSIVENAFFQETGNYPTAGAWTQVNSPTGGATVNSSGPLPSSLSIGGSGSGATGAVVSGVSGAASTLASIGTYGVVGIAALALILVLIVGFAPNTKAVAEAVR